MYYNSFKDFAAPCFHTNFRPKLFNLFLYLCGIYLRHIVVVFNNLRRLEGMTIFQRAISLQMNFKKREFYYFSKSQNLCKKIIVFYYNFSIFQTVKKNKSLYIESQIIESNHCHCLKIVEMVSKYMKCHYFAILFRMRSESDKWS